MFRFRPWRCLARTPSGVGSKRRFLSHALCDSREAPYRLDLVAPEHRRRPLAWGYHARIQSVTREPAAGGDTEVPSSSERSHGCNHSALPALLAIARAQRGATRLNPGRNSASIEREWRRSSLATQSTATAHLASSHLTQQPRACAARSAAGVARPELPIGLCEPTPTAGPDRRSDARLLAGGNAIAHRGLRIWLGP